MPATRPAAAASYGVAGLVEEALPQKGTCCVEAEHGRTIGRADRGEVEVAHGHKWGKDGIACFRLRHARASGIYEGCVEVEGVIAMGQGACGPVKVDAGMQVRRWAAGAHEAAGRWAGVDRAAAASEVRRHHGL